MKPFLVLQLRPETEASDDEYGAILAKGRLAPEDTRRIRLDKEDLPEGLDLSAFAGVIVGGGPGCVSDAPEDKDPLEARIEAGVLGLMPQITAGDVPFMGCCYGISVLAHHLGTEVSKRRWGEPVGPTHCVMTDAGRADPLVQGLPDRFEVFVGHKEAVQSLPEGCVHLLDGDTCRFQMIRYKSNVYATQFHPELDSDGLEVRINVYRHRGYFAPEEADGLIAQGRAADVHVPETILQRFVARFRDR